MRIVHVSHKAHDVRARRAARAAAASGHEVLCVLGTMLDAQSAALLEVESGDPGVRWLRMHGRAPAAVIREAVLSLAPDVLHLHELDAVWQMLGRAGPETFTLRRRGTPIEGCGYEIAHPGPRVVFDLHEWEPDRPYQWQDPDEDAERRWKFFECRPVVDVIVGPSPSVARQLTEAYGAPAGWAPNSPPAPASFRSLRGRQVRERLGLGAAPVVVFAGNPTPDRRVQDLARAMHELAAKGWRLLLVGNRAPKATRGMLESVPGAVWAGPAPYPWPGERDLDLLDYLSAGTVGFNGGNLRFLNWQWGLPNKVFEYAFAGVPCVSSRMLPVVDLYRQHPAWGRCYDDTVASLVDAIEATAEGPRPNAQAAWREWSFEAKGWPVYERAYGGAT